MGGMILPWAEIGGWVRMSGAYHASQEYLRYYFTVLNFLDFCACLRHNCPVHIKQRVKIW